MGIRTMMTGVMGTQALSQLNRAWEGGLIGPISYGAVGGFALISIAEARLYVLEYTIEKLLSEGRFIAELKNKTINQIVTQLVSPHHLSKVFDLFIRICNLTIEAAPLVEGGLNILNQAFSFGYKFDKLNELMTLIRSRSRELTLGYSVVPKDNDFTTEIKPPNKEFLKGVSDLCKYVIDCRLLLNSAPSTTQKMELTTTLDEIKASISEHLLRPIATSFNEIPEGENSERADHSLPYFGLGSRGWRDSDYQRLAREIGWDEGNFLYLPLAFAAKQIFSTKQLGLANEDSIDEMMTKVILCLKDKEPFLQGKIGLWQERFKPVCQKIALVVAIVLQITSFYSFVRNSHKSNGHWYLFCEAMGAIDWAYFGHQGQWRPLPCSQFVGGTWKERVAWISHLSNPLKVLANAMAYADRTLPVEGDISAKGKYVLNILRRTYWGF